VDEGDVGPRGCRRLCVRGVLGSIVLHQAVLEGVHVENIDAEQFRGILRLDQVADFDKGHNIVTVCAPRVLGFASVDPGLEGA
jgi:hypothetical protein